MKIYAIVLCTVLASLVGSPRAQAESTRFFEVEGFGRLLDSNPDSTAINEDGAISLPPLVNKRFADANDQAFGAACAQGDRIIVSRVEDGEILAIDKKGQAQALYKVQEAMVTALLCTPDAVYIAAAGEKARIYRMDRKGRIETWLQPQAHYIWDMQLGAANNILIATGEPGTVLEFSSQKAGVSKCLFEADQAHLKTLAFDPNMGTFVGGGEKGIVYFAPPKQTDFRALYDIGTPEVTALLPKAPYIFAAGVLGAANLLNDSNETGNDASAKKAKTEVRSQLVRLRLDGTAEAVAGSNDEAIFALGLDAQEHIVAATGAAGRDDPRGRLYMIDPENKTISMLYQANAQRITHVLQLPQKNLALIANASAQILDVTTSLAKRGIFYTQPFDTGIHSTFGSLQLLGSIPEKSRAQIAIRTGQTNQPDKTWSNWSNDVAAPKSKAVDVRPGRFVQARLTLEGNGNTTPLIHRLRVAYLRQNVPPFIRDVTALRKGWALVPVPHEDIKTKIVALAERSDEQGAKADAPTATTSVPRFRQTQQHGALTIKWLSDDANGDDLRFELWARGADATQWFRLKGDLEDPYYSFLSTQLADGYYFFRVIASDAPSNPDGMQREEKRESRAILIDNTPPKFKPLNIRTAAQQVQIKGSLSDNLGPLTLLTYALDGQTPHPVAVDDGVLDGPEETFTLLLEHLAVGEHIISIRAQDESDNESTVDATFSITK